ncbi:type II secretion system protein GspG [Anaerovibrio slackiae]|uniref:type II secretion system protein GspG n=1 Tax=Anaerovibrio slackiae TaxID=2652309 RepID=UPI00386EBBC2
MKRYKAKGVILMQAVAAVLMIAILSAVTIVAGRTYINAGKRSTAAADTAALGGFISQYHMEIGSYPGTLSDLTKAKGQYGPWIRAVPRDPFGNSYQYSSNEKKGFIVFSVGQDGRAASSIDNGICGDDIGYSE